MSAPARTLAPRSQNGRGAALGRALALVAAFHAHRLRGLSREELGQVLELGRRSTYRWLVEAQRHLPLEQVKLRGQPVRYRLVRIEGEA